MNHDFKSSLCAFLAATVMVGVVFVRPAYAQDKRVKASGQGRIVPAYGPFGRLPMTGEHRSPDGRYILRATHHEADTENVEVIDAKSGKRFVSAEDVMGFAWVPGRGHRLVVAACGLYGTALLAMWEGGTHWRRLRRVRRPKNECFTLVGVTKDGRSIIYGYANLAVDDAALRRRRRLRLPRATPRTPRLSSR